MAPLFITSTKVLFLLVLSASVLVHSYSYTTSSSPATLQSNSHPSLARRVLEKIDPDDDEVQVPIKKKQSTTSNALSTTLSSTKTKNESKPIKPKVPTTSANSTKLIKTASSNKNSTKTTKDSSSQDKTILKINLKKLNSTSKASNSTKPYSKTTNSTKSTTKDSALQEKSNPKVNLKKSNSTSKPLNSIKPTSKTTSVAKPTSKNTNLAKPNSLLSQKSTDPTKSEKKVQKKPTKTPNWSYEEDEDEDDLVSEFRDLPSRFQETLIPDLEALSTTSKAYLNKASKEMTKGFKPYVGNKYAATVASVVSFAFILIPFLLVSLIFNQIKAYFSLQKLIIFVQIYLAIYFSILCLSSLVTGLEPLRFFYATSRSTYICVQLLQTLAYVLYLLLLLMYLVLVFSTETGVGSKLMAVGQTVVGCAVGLHYYVTVFHRAVLRQPPKSSWRVHAIYATCFLLICLLGRLERRKKAYMVDGTEEPKKS